MRLARRCRVVLLLGALFLAGCAAVPLAPPRADLDVFSLEGRFSLRHEATNYSGRISWRHQGVNDTLLLSSPLGQGMAEITTSAQGARLATGDGKVYAAASVESLTQQVLGYPLPLAKLTDWVRGQSGAVDSSEHDAFGRLQRFSHEGWRIDYGYDSDDPQAPPNRIFAERAGGFDLRLRIDEWSSIVSGDVAP